MTPIPAQVPILGAPTASGKSAAALRLAERLDLELVSADAMQVYRGLDVGTAKPSPAERARVPHHLVDVVDPDEAFNVARWVRLAEEAIAAVQARGRQALVVGGTGFYLHALVHGLPGTPEADTDAQAPLWRIVERDGIEPLLEELRAHAPTDAARAERNPRRVVRAVEVLRRTGRPPSAFPRSRPRFRYDRAWLLPEPERLEARIDRRARAMFDAGLVDEVRRLRARWPEWATATQAIGYKEVLAHLRGETTVEEAREAVRLATRRYAKRQRTWFRAARSEHRWEALAEEALPELEAWLSRLATGGPPSRPV